MSVVLDMAGVHRMPTVDRSEFRFGVTVLTKRREVLYALRALSMAAQRTGNNKLPWSGVTDDSWRARRGLATFRFDRQEYRDQFVGWARELLRAQDWSYVGDSDEDLIDEHDRSS